MVAGSHGPRSVGVAERLIDPVLVVPQHSMPVNGAGMTGNRVRALPSRSTLRTWRRHLVFLLPRTRGSHNRLNTLSTYASMRPRAATASRPPFGGSAGLDPALAMARGSNQVGRGTATAKSCSSSRSSVLTTSAPSGMTPVHRPQNLDVCAKRVMDTSDDEERHVDDVVSSSRFGDDPILQPRASVDRAADRWPRDDEL